MLKENLNTVFNAFTCEIIENDEVEVTLLSSNNTELDVVIPEIIENKAVTSLRLGAGYTNSRLKSLTIPKTVTSFGEMPSFFNATPLKVAIDDENPAFCVVDNVVYSKDMSHLVHNFNCECEEFTVPESVKHIDEKAFEYQQNLKKVILPNGIVSIASAAFGHCRMLAEIDGAENANEVAKDAFDGTKYLNTIDELILGGTLVCYRKNDSRIYHVPDGITEIWNNAFLRNSGEDQLEEIVLPDTLKKIGPAAFTSRDKVKAITIPEGVEEICSNVFAECRGLEVVNIPASVKEMPANAFYNNFSTGCLREINIAEGNPCFKSIDGVLYSADGTKLIKVPVGYAGELVVAEGTEVIGEKAAYNNRKIKRVVLPCSLKKIQAQAFDSCIELEEVISDDCHDVSVGAFSFSGCHLLRKINLECADKIGYGAFKSCGSLENITLNCKKIEKEAFFRCNTLSSVKLNGTETIEHSAFAKSGISELKIPDTVTEIGASAFEETNLIKVIVPKTVDSVDDHAFGSIKHLVIYDNLKGNIGTLCVNGLLGSSYFNSGTVTSYTITVLSADDDSEKFTAVIENDNTILCSNILKEAWGENNTFNFRAIDAYFTKMKVVDMKIRTAIRRIKEPYMLSDEARETYVAYLSRSAKAIIKGLIDQNDFETFTSLVELGIIKKSNIDDFIDYSLEKQAVEFSAFLMDYKENVLKIKEENIDPVKAMEKEMNKDPYLVKDMKLIWDYQKSADDTISIKRFIGDPDTTEYFIPPRIGKNPVTEVNVPSYKKGDVIHVPESVTALHVKGLLESTIEFDGENNTNVLIEDGFVFSRDMKKIFALTREIGGDQWIIPEGIESIDCYLLNYCPDLKSIVIPASFNEIIRIYGKRVEILVSEDNPLFKSDSGLLLSRDGKTLLACTVDVECLGIPEGVETVDQSMTMREFLSVNIPSTLNEMVSLHDDLIVNVSEDNPFFKSQDNMILSKDGLQLLHWNRNDEKLYRIPDGVTDATAMQLKSEDTLICPQSIEKINFGRYGSGCCFVCPGNEYTKEMVSSYLFIEYREAFLENKLDLEFLSEDFSGKKVCFLSRWYFDFSKPIEADNNWNVERNRYSWLLAYIESKGGDVSDKVYKDTDYVLFERAALTSTANRPELYYTKEYRQFEKALANYDKRGNIVVVRCDTEEAKAVLDTLNPEK